MTTRTVQAAVFEHECDRCGERCRSSGTSITDLPPEWANVTAWWRTHVPLDDRSWHLCGGCHLLLIGFMGGRGRPDGGAEHVQSSSGDDADVEAGIDDVPDGAECSGGGHEIRNYPLCEMDDCTAEAEIDIGPRMVCTGCAAEIDHARRLFRQLAGALRQKRPEHVRLAPPPPLPPASPVPDFARAALRSMRIQRRADVCTCGHLRALHDMDGRLSNGARSQRCTAYVALPYRDDGFIDANGQITTCTCDHFRSELELDAAAGDS